MTNDETKVPDTPFRPPQPGERSEPPGADDERPLPPDGAAAHDTGATAIPNPVDPL